jgi:hypothetical protein
VNLPDWTVAYSDTKRADRGSKIFNFSAKSRQESFAGETARAWQVTGDAPEVDIVITRTQRVRHIPLCIIFRHKAVADKMPYQYLKMLAAIIELLETILAFVWSGIATIRPARAACGRVADLNLIRGRIASIVAATEP